MSSTRSVIAPPPFAANALTVIPPTPVAGVSYRDPTAGPASSPDGWPYAERVNSAEWNQIMFQLSSLVSIMDKKGVLGWSSDVDYTEASVQFGSDGVLYQWLQASGPNNGGAKDPVSEPTYWKTLIATNVTQGIKGAAANLKISTTGLSTIATITADSFCVQNSSGSIIALQGINLSIDLSTVGANGRDTAAALAASTWYNFHIIYNPTSGQVRGLASTSATSPVLPSGFTHSGRAGADRTQPGSPFNLLSYFQVGRSASYKVLAGTNVLSFPAASSGTAVLSTVPLANFVPPTAIKARLAAGSTNAYVGFAPTGSFSSNPGASYLSAATLTGFPFVGGYNASSPVPTTNSEVPLDNSMSVLYASTGVQGILQCMGWEDSL